MARLCFLTTIYGSPPCSNPPPPLLSSISSYVLWYGACKRLGMVYIGPVVDGSHYPWHVFSIIVMKKVWVWLSLSFSLFFLSLNGFFNTDNWKEVVVKLSKITTMRRKEAMKVQSFLYYVFFRCVVSFTMNEINGRRKQTRPWVRSSPPYLKVIFRIFKL